MSVAISEAQWQEQFCDLLRATGWKWMHVRRSLGKGRKWTTATNQDGWPDLTIWSERRGRVAFVELKSEAGRLRPAQEALLRSLLAAKQDVKVWRPSQLEEAQAWLTAIADTLIAIDDPEHDAIGRVAAAESVAARRPWGMSR